MQAVYNIFDHNTGEETMNAEDYYNRDQKYIQTGEYDMDIDDFNFGTAMVIGEDYNDNIHR